MPKKRPPDEIRSIWARHGFVLPGWWQSVFRTPTPIRTGPARFRAALEELGGLYTAFGRFLGGRTDILPSDYTTHLSGIRLPNRQRLLPLLISQLGSRISRIEPVLATPMTEVYRALHQGVGVALEVFPASPPGEAEWADFIAGLKPLRRSPERVVLDPCVLRDFRAWVELHHDSGRKLKIWKHILSLSAETASCPPRPVAGLQTPQILAFYPPDGAFLRQDSQGGLTDSAELGLAAEAVLEQSLFLAAVPADFDPANLLITADGRLGYFCPPAVATIPAEHSFEVTQYVSSAIAGETSRSIHMLARICSLDLTMEGEEKIWQEFSALQPELRVGRSVAPSIASLQNLWQALAAADLNPPLFLTLLHRQMLILDDHAGRLENHEDILAERLWPVVGRLLRFRFGELMSEERIREWALGSGLLFVGMARQLGLTLERFRDNDFAVLIDTPRGNSQERRSGRRLISLLLTAALLAMWMVLLHYSLSAASGWSPLLSTVTLVVTAILLFMLILRLE